MPQKKIPQRMCLGCGQMKPKADLMRVVKSPDGQILTDPAGKANGRGAYVCRDRACLEKARKTRRLERTFSAPVSEEIWTALFEKAEDPV